MSGSLKSDFCWLVTLVGHFGWLVVWLLSRVGGQSGLLLK